MDELYKYFGMHIKRNTNVKEPEIVAALKMSKFLQRRSWTTVKTKVNYILMQNRKKAKKQ